MKKNRAQIITIFYKIFILLLILNQLYVIIWQAINFYTILINIILTLYLIFRYYLLCKLSKKANKFNISLPKLLQNEHNGSHTCSNCGSKNKS